MSNIHRHLALIIALSAGASEAWCASVTIGASKDNTIFQNVPNRSAGGSAGIFAGTTGRFSPRRGLIAFDVAANVPADATITEVELRLYLAATGGGMSQSVGLHRLTKDWGEGTAGDTLAEVRMSGNGFTASPGDATWNENFLGTSLWSSPGATGDFNALPSASSIINASVNVPFYWLSTPAVVSDVQNWLDSPTTNFGWAIVNANEVDIATAKAFYSRSATLDASGEYLDLTWRPTLTITYTVPEPSTGVAPISVCGLMFVVSRRCRKAALRQLSPLRGWH